MRLGALLLAPLVAASLARPVQAASPAAEESARLLALAEPRMKAIYETDEFRTRSFRATWLPDGSGFLKMETPAGATVPEVARYDAADGTRTVVVSREKLIAPGGSQPVKLHWFQRAPSGNRFLLHGEITEGKRRGGHWLYEPEPGALRALDAGPGLWFDANAFSPDGGRLVATRGADLVMLDIATGREIALTKDGVSGTVENGHRAAWSPDGKWLVYIQTDSSAVPKRAVLVPGDPTYRTFREQTFERIGGPISTFRIGVAVVPKPQAEFYNAWYQEIFMRTPKENPEGYRTSSAITYAEGLRGGLLIITDSGETNTHIEITEGLVDRLIALGKRFDYFVYPNRDHGLNEGKGSSVHVRKLIVRYLIEHLPPGPRTKVPYAHSINAACACV